jgi:hypothetical protein
MSGRIAETAFDLDIDRFTSFVLALNAGVPQGFWRMPAIDRPPGCNRGAFGPREVQAFRGRVESLPSLIRFLIVVAAVAAIVYGVMIALVTYVTPQPRQMTYTIPAQRLNK